MASTGMAAGDEMHLLVGTLDGPGGERAAVVSPVPGGEHEAMAARMLFSQVRGGGRDSVARLYRVTARVDALLLSESEEGKA